MDMQPIKSEHDYERALSEIDALFDAEPNTPDGDRLDLIVSLVEVYEQRHHPIPLPDPIDALQYHLDSRELPADFLVPFIGSADRVRQVWSRERPLSLLMIRKLQRGLGISADILIQPYPLTVSRKRTHPASRSVGQTA